MSQMENPYDSPALPAEDDHSHESPAKHPGFGLEQFTKFVVVMTAVGAIVGTLIGLLLEVFAPDYYRAVFASGNQANFNPIAIGIGLGVTQGALMGLVADLVLVVSYCWYKVRTLS